MVINWQLLIFSVTVAWLIGKVIPVFRRILLLRAIPSLPEDKLIGGHLHMFAPETSVVDRAKLYAIARKRGKLARTNVSFGLPLSIDLLHPDVVSAVFNTNVESKASFSPYRFSVPLLGNSIFLAGGAEWKRKRDLVKRAFTRQQVRFFFDDFRCLANELVNDWCRRIDSEGIINERSGKREISIIADKYLAKVTLESFMRCAFCLPSSDWILNENPYVALLDPIGHSIINRLNNPLNLFDFYYYHISAEGRCYKNLCLKCLNITQTIIDKRRKAFEKEQNQGGAEAEAKCLLDVLLKTYVLDSILGLSEKDLLYECQMFIIAGFETTYNSLTWTMYLLGSHPEELRRCQEEIDRVLGDDDKLTPAVIGEITYVTQCIKEAFRLYPVGYVEPRLLPKETVLDGFAIPAGTVVNGDTEALHRDPAFWEKPDDFFPEHFSAEQTGKRRSDVFRPFSSGPRKCIGEIFSMEEMKVVLISLLKRFDFIVDPCHEVRDTPKIVLAPVNGIKLIVRHRSS